MLATAAFPFIAYLMAEEWGICRFITITDGPEDFIRVATATNNRREGTIPGVSISLRKSNVCYP